MNWGRGAEVGVWGVGDGLGWGEVSLCAWVPACAGVTEGGAGVAVGSAGVAGGCGGGGEGAGVVG